MLQAARANAIRSLLIFLHLLERDAECIAKSRLAHAKHHSTRSHPAAHVLVDRVEGLLCHARALSTYQCCGQPANRIRIRNEATRILQHPYILCEQMAGYIVAARRSTDRALLVSRRSRATTASGKTSPLKSGSGTSTSHNPTKFPGCRAAENPTPSRRTATARELSPTARNSLFRITR